MAQVINKSTRRFLVPKISNLAFASLMVRAEFTDKIVALVVSFMEHE